MGELDMWSVCHKWTTLSHFLCPMGKMPGLSQYVDLSIPERIFWHCVEKFLPEELYVSDISVREAVHVELEVSVNLSVGNVFQFYWDY